MQIIYTNNKTCLYFNTVIAKYHKQDGYPVLKNDVVQVMVQNQTVHVRYICYSCKYITI